ncbi:regulatory protein, luxR family [Fodinibius roseus]|uniref:Regulatory protein, luxR family n=1 Tax=Fodinibius roseus TaxID=1194090 RepID=A0A1M4SFZ6_9BACT|nr:LuxR C-terminal-related transcriptional regulator [Fodinibius roseus]SHE31184.1 regulatory protein, luxR family [Fodinibius roseus]
MEADKHEESVYIEALKILTPREIEVLELIGKGYTCKHVAEKLNLSVYTVQTYVKVIKRKLSVKGYRGLVLWYHKNWEG